MKCAFWEDCGAEATELVARGREELDVCGEHAVVLDLAGGTVRDLRPWR